MNRFHPMMVSPQSCPAIDLQGERGGVSPLVLPLVSHDNRTDDAEHALKNHPAHAGRSPHVRTGATLVEVLMALLIMAVGVTSVFTLFPLSILKAIQANHLTNAKLYEGAIKDTLLTHPQLWTGAPEWKENTEYAQLAAVAPYSSRWVTPKASGRMLPETNQLFFGQVDPSLMPVPSAPFYSGSRQPIFNVSQTWVPNDYDSVTNPNVGGYQNIWPVTGTLPNTGTPTSTYDGVLQWIPYRHSQYQDNPLWSAYVVDPLGWYRAGPLIDQAQFGEIISADSSGAANTINMDRIHCQLASGAADSIYRLQDSWNVVLEPTPVTVTTPSATQVQIEFPTTLTSVVDNNTLSPIHRIVLLSTFSPRVVALPVLGASNTPSGSSFLTLDGVLPAGIIFDQARIEVQAPGRYSWLMSVHSGPRGEFDAQCAVVFNRSFETLDEQGYRAEFCRTEDLNGNGAIDPGEDAMLPNGRLDTNIAKVRWPYDPNADAPRIKEGGYIFDASLGYWYKIQKIEKINDEEQQRVDGADALDPAGAFVRTILTLSDQVKLNTGSSSDVAPFTDYRTNGTIDCQAVLLPGVIHVFTPDLPQ